MFELLTENRTSMLQAKRFLKTHSQIRFEFISCRYLKTKCFFSMKAAVSCYPFSTFIAMNTVQDRGYCHEYITWTFSCCQGKRPNVCFIGKDVKYICFG